MASKMWGVSAAVLAVLLVAVVTMSNSGPVRRLGQQGVRGSATGQRGNVTGQPQNHDDHVEHGQAPGTTPAPAATTQVPASTTRAPAPGTTQTPAPSTTQVRATSTRVPAPGTTLATTAAPVTSLQLTASSVAQQILLLVNSASDRGHALGGLVRLAFHDAATFNGTVGGADGCVDLTSSANGGLQTVVDSLAPVVLTAQGVLSRADVWALAANVAIEIAGGPTLSFQAGRVDSTHCTGQDNLPDAQQGATMIESIFVTRLGFTEAEATALIGAHVLGKAQTVNSGYKGQWVPTNSVWSNQYFVDLLGKPWHQTTLPAFQGQARDQWNGPAGTLMLNTDIVLAFDTTACTTAGGKGSQCPRATHGFSTAVTQFVASNAAFNAVFVTAFTKLTALGPKPGSLTCVMSDCSTPSTQR